MDSLIASLVVCVSVTGCEHKAPPHQDQQGKNPWEANGNAAGSGSAVTLGMSKPATPPPAPPPAPPPVDKGPPTPAPTGDVRPPVAADLAEYTKGIKGKGPLTATIDTTLGTFHCELFPDKAPMTVANFVGLATGKKAWLNPKTNQVEKGKPFYNGLIFHRVIQKFMIQGGDATGTGTGNPGYAFDDEISPDLTMKEGTLAMANAGSRGGHGTNGSQFFITEIAPTWLNGKHTIFGQCKEVDLVKKITAVEKGPQDRPKTDVVMTKVTISK
jgi:peptidyl-prolyl cis-trans isomerase A (cyclophilin A)